MTFGEALGALLQGQDRRGRRIELATNVSYVYTVGEVVHDQMGNKAVAFVGTSGVQLGWLASQIDMLSSDWVMRNDL
jgi:hypothetical protein